ncbi:hypothetical protein DFJ58DRAFT_758721 [Suillus subalutaceus]|uniref:uncharacterized protein n=1 Tax=Suillus subalutaceus TaxID=48586 RepID=UPI001B878126|nr:uncharacterized protein DFJ58DRAFT_758721 [Suillus subalutaceus]KAG1874778.1 hypothetical protein DFJ58DRAFT_758721 [Suillus subalutaceus]
MGTVDNTFGALLIGVVVSATLYGVTCVQTWYYFTHFSDPWYNKLLVGAMFLSDSIHQILVTHAMYTYLVTDFGSVSEIFVWSLCVEVLFNGFTGFMVQSFLTMRVYRLSNKNVIATASVLSLVIAEFILVITYFAKAVTYTTFNQLPQIKPLSMSVNAVAAAGDILITIFLCIFLQQSRTGFRRSDTLINKLMLFSINTGLLTTVCAVMSLISITVWPDSFIYIAFYFCMGRFYCNSLLATLNARKGIRHDSCEEHMSLSLQGVRRPINSPIGSSRIGMPNDISIKIDTAQEYIEDEFLSAKDLKSSQSV